MVTKVPSEVMLVAPYIFLYTSGTIEGVEGVEGVDGVEVDAFLQAKPRMMSAAKVKKLFFVFMFAI
jgi:hypothetical protein